MTYYFESSKCLFLGVILIIIACNPTKDSDTGGIQVKITHSVGDSFIYGEDSKKTSFLPYIANEGKYMNEDVAIIGKKIKAGSNVGVTLLGRLNYRHEQKDLSVIIAIPTDEKHRSIEMNSFDDLITRNYAVKHMIEYWYANRFGLGSVSDTRWSVYKRKN